MMTKECLVIIVTLSLIACGKSTNSDLKIPDKPVPASDSKTTIIKYDTTQHWIFKNGTPTTLSPKEITDIEEILKLFVADYNAAREKYIAETQPKLPDQRLANEDFMIELKNYNRQYVPVINARGEKEIWVNCFCIINGTDWRERVVIVDDGGKCFFNLKINLTARTYYDESVNGEA